MRLNMRRLQPGAVFGSFLGILDIKLGCEIVLLFGLINKVAGVYGLITVFVGGTFVQFLFYAYSIASLFAFLWALNVVKSETAHKTLIVAHLYALDHVILQVFHYIFYYTYWFINKHDGKRVLNSQAQIDIVELAVSRKEIPPMDMDPTSAAANDELKAMQALDIWNHEKGYAVGVVCIGFIMKIYFILLLYSYAAHLRSSTYHNLPLTAHVNEQAIALARASGRTGGPHTPSASISSTNGTARPIPSHADEDDDDRELASAEAEVARIHQENRESRRTNQASDDFDSWE